MINRALKKIILEEIRNVLKEDWKDDIDKRAQDAFDNMDKEAEKEAPPRPAPKQPPSQQQKPQPQQPQQKPQPQKPQQPVNKPLVLMTAAEATKLAPAVYVSIANAAIEYLSEYQESQPDVSSRSDMMFKLIDANKQLNVARKNPKYFPQDKFAVISLSKMRDLMNSNRAEFDTKVKRGQNTRIE